MSVSTSCSEVDEVDATAIAGARAAFDFGGATEAGCTGASAGIGAATGPATGGGFGAGLATGFGTDLASTLAVLATLAACGRGLGRGIGAADPAHGSAIHGSAITVAASQMRAQRPEMVGDVVKTCPFRISRPSTAQNSFAWIKLTIP